MDIVVVNLNNAGRLEELGDGSLYIKLQKKITESMLAQYHRWLLGKGKLESVETFKNWSMQEAEFRIVAHETVREFSIKTNDVGNRKGKTLKIRSYFTTGENKQNAENRRSGYSTITVKLLVDARAKFVAINMEYEGVKVLEKWTYLNDGKWQNSRNYVIGVLMTIIMELLALKVEYVE